MNKLLLIVFLVVITSMLPLVSYALGSEQESVAAAERVPKSYIGAVRTLESVKHELKELSTAYQLYKFHEPLELFDAIVVHLNERADHDIYHPMRKEIEGIIEKINHISKKLEIAADKSDSEYFNVNLSNLNNVIQQLKKYFPQSNESHVELGHNIPPTYKKLVNRMRGVYYSLKEISGKGYLYKSHEDIEHIQSAANSLSQIFEANIMSSLKDKLEHNLSIIRKFSETLHHAGDNEDRDVALAAFTTEVATAIHKLEELGVSKRSFQSTLDRADYLFKQKKLTRPIGDNAYELYKKVSDAEPSNQRAKLGIEKIVGWYFHSIKDLIEHGSWNKVSVYSKRILSISPHNEKAKEYYELAQRRHHHD